MKLLMLKDGQARTSIQHWFHILNSKLRPLLVQHSFRLWGGVWRLGKSSYWNKQGFGLRICLKRKTSILWRQLKRISCRWRLTWFNRFRIWIWWRWLDLWLCGWNFLIILRWLVLDRKRGVRLVSWSMVFLCGFSKTFLFLVCLVLPFWSLKWWGLIILPGWLSFRIEGRRLGLLIVVFLIFNDLLSPLGFEFTASVFICVVDYFKLAGVDVQDCSSEDVFELDTRIFASF